MDPCKRFGPFRGFIVSLGEYALNFQPQPLSGYNPFVVWIYEHSQGNPEIITNQGPPYSFYNSEIWLGISSGTNFDRSFFPEWSLCQSCYEVKVLGGDSVAAPPRLGISPAGMKGVYCLECGVRIRVQSLEFKGYDIGRTGITKGP